MERFVTFLFLFAVSYGQSPATNPNESNQQLSVVASHDPEVTMKVPEIIRRWEYPVEVYDVTTEDGYILEMHRIPHGRTENGDSIIGPKPVIYLQHGLECSSSNWVANLPHQSAGFIFADAGYDVWMGNFRGNTYGRRHISLKPDDRKFWEFSWDESAKYDLKALINFVLNKTGQQSVSYVAHSEGTLTAFAKFSEDVEFGKKVSKLFALAPIVTIKHTNTLFRFISIFTPQLQFLFKIVGYNEFLPSSKLMTFIAKYVCGSVIPDVVLCENVFFLIAGPNGHQLNATRVPVYVGHVPAGTSTQNMIHFAQMAKHGLFNYYDYGSRSKNQAKYGVPTPPLYPLEAMQVPVYLFYGDLDALADVQDVEANIHRFSKIRGVYKLNQFNHADFIYGLRAAPEIYAKILKLIAEEKE